MLQVPPSILVSVAGLYTLDTMCTTFIVAAVTAAACFVYVKQPFSGRVYQKCKMDELHICNLTWTIRAVDQKHLESSEMWCWRRMENISWSDHVRNEEVLLRVKEQRNILHEISKWKANLIGHILCRNCLLQRVTNGKIKGGIDVTGRRGRRRRKLLDDLKERRGYSHLKEETLGRTMWRAHFGRGFGPVVRLTAK